MPKKLNQMAVSPAEAADLLGVGRSTVYKLIATRTLMARKAGRRTVILTADIERYLEALPLLEAQQPKAAA